MDSKKEKQNINIENMSYVDKINLELLNIQSAAQTIFIYSDILAYTSTMEGIELIYSKYDGIERNFNPDIPALQAAYLALFAKAFITQVGFTRYDNLCDRYKKGEITFSLEPNIDINIGNTLGLVANFYILKGVKGIYKRDLENPVFGI